MNNKNIELPENIKQGIEKIVTTSFPTIPFEIIFSLEMHARVTDHPEHLSNCFEELAEIEKFRTPQFPEHRDTQDMLEYFKQVCERERMIFEAISQSISIKLRSDETLEQFSKLISEINQA